MREMQLSVGRITIILGVITYIAALYIAYIYLISPAYSYYQLTNLHPSLWVAILSSLLAILPSFWLEYRVQRPSQVIYWTLYLFAYIPVIIIPDFIRVDALDSFWIFKLVVFAGLMILYFFSKISLIELPNTNFPVAAVNVGIFVGMSLLYAVMIKAYGFHINPVSFKEVYGVREVYRSETGRIAGYAVTWLSKIMDMFMITIGIMRGQLLLLFVGIFGQVYVYSVSGHKSVVLSMGLLFVILFCLRKSGRTFGISFVWFMVAFVVLAILVDIFNDNIALTEIFTRRMLLLPGALSSLFFDFFSTHEKTYLGHSILGFFVDYPYKASPSHLIGFTYFGSEEMSANVNMWADAYSAFGYAGVIAFSVLLGCVLWLYDSIAQKRNFVLSVALMVMPAWSLVDSSFIIALFTNGIVIAMGLNYVYRSDLWEGNEHVSAKNISNPV
ncbi:hypothetical protein [Listeria booriae]|uniref:hypothetical protein n=1 Tax=Listeria booriae TaxID=1552123 RepID=UPI001628C82B|nr:hypothetical protein [Listeria booriae]MBC2147731.1 hypothetical protein [Listeria booriae]